MYKKTTKTIERIALKDTLSRAKKLVAELRHVYLEKKGLFSEQGFQLMLTRAICKVGLTTSKCTTSGVLINSNCTKFLEVGIKPDLGYGPIPNLLIEIDVKFEGNFVTNIAGIFITKEVI